MAARQAVSKYVLPRRARSSWALRRLKPRIATGLLRIR